MFGPIPVDAAGYPEKAITLIVPMAPGGSTDLGARLLAEAMEKRLKVPVTVVNKPGGAQTLGGYAVASAKPDGYTLGFLALAGSIPEAFNYFYSAPYSSADLTPICRVQSVVLTLTVKGDAPWNSVKEFVEYAKKNPRMKYATHGKSTQGFVIMSTIAKEEKTKFVDVSCDSDGTIMPQVLGGHVAFGTPALSSTKSLRDAKRIKVLAVLMDKRAEVEPGIPAISEFGYKPSYVGMNGMFGPKGLSDEVVTKINETVNSILQDKQFQDKARKIDLELTREETPSFKKSLVRTKESLLTFFKAEGMVKK